MGTFKSFEEIQAWQNARTLAQKIYNLTLDGTFARDYKLKDQINGSSGSIMDNIAEGFERDGTREFIQFLSVSKGSAGETRSQLYRAFDRKHISNEQFEQLKEETIRISKQLSSLMRYLGRSDLKGTKYMEDPNEEYREPKT